MKNVKSRFRGINTAYKIGLVTAGIGFLAGASSFVFVVLPTYNIVGDTLNSTTASAETEKADSQLQRLEKTANGIHIVVYSSVLCATVAIAIGALIDAKAKKSKSKR